MTETKPWFEEVPLPALLRHARSTYGAAMRQALIDAGYDDIPRNGIYIIGGLALGAGGLPLKQLAEELQISAQAVGQLVDTLIDRGYLKRDAGKSGSAKPRAALTERGLAAAAAQLAAREKIDAELTARAGEDDVARTRRTLAILANIGRPCEGPDDGH